MNAKLRSGRACLLGICFSLLGFSWAIATPNSNPASSDSPRPSPRTVGSGLRFSNPFLLAGQDPTFPSGGNTATDPGGYDLGDVFFGSQFTRYVTALGGVRPYSFTMAGQPGISGVTLDPSGRLSGALQSNSPQNFNGIVTDAAGVSRLGYFRLFGQTPIPGEFRFEMDRLPLARVGADYITNLEATNQDAATVFSVVPGSVVLNGSPLANLEANGLTLAQDGNLAGRPLNSGTLTFVARAMKGGVIAFNRAGTAPDQSFAINIAVQTAVQSVMATQISTLTGNFAGKQVPTFQLSAFINMLPQPAGSLNGRHFVFRLGGQTFSASLNGAGIGRTSNGRVSVSTLSGSTFLQLHLRDSALLKIVSSSVADGSHQTLVAEIELGSTFLGTEPIEFSVRNRNGRFKLSYNILKDRQIGGLFQIANATAQDSFFGQGTQFHIGFLISNVKGQSTSDFGIPQSATVRIGPGFVQSLPLKGGHNNFNGQVFGSANAHINLASKFGTVNTAFLPQSETNIAPVSISNNSPQTLLFGLDLQTTTQLFSGDTSELLFPLIVVFVFDPFFDNGDDFFDCGGD